MNPLKKNKPAVHQQKNDASRQQPQQPNHWGLPFVLACVGGAAFGAPECIRMSYATSDDKLVEAFARIKEALAQLH